MRGPQVAGEEPGGAGRLPPVKHRAGDAVPTQPGGMQLPHTWADLSDLLHTLEPHSVSGNHTRKPVWTPEPKFKSSHKKTKSRHAGSNLGSSGAANSSVGPPAHHAGHRAWLQSRDSNRMEDIPHSLQAPAPFTSQLPGSKVKHGAHLPSPVRSQGLRGQYSQAEVAAGSSSTHLPSFSSHLVVGSQVVFSATGSQHTTWPAAGTGHHRRSSAHPHRAARMSPKGRQHAADSAQGADSRHIDPYSQQYSQLPPSGKGMLSGSDATGGGTARITWVPHGTPQPGSLRSHAVHTWAAGPGADQGEATQARRQRHPVFVYTAVPLAKPWPQAHSPVLKSPGRGGKLLLPGDRAVAHVVVTQHAAAVEQANERVAAADSTAMLATSSAVTNTHPTGSLLSVLIPSHAPTIDPGKGLTGHMAALRYQQEQQEQQLTGSPSPSAVSAASPTPSVGAGPPGQLARTSPTPSCEVPASSPLCSVQGEWQLLPEPSAAAWQPSEAASAVHTPQPLASELLDGSQEVPPSGPGRPQAASPFADPAMQQGAAQDGDTSRAGSPVSMQLPAHGGQETANEPHPAQAHPGLVAPACAPGAPIAGALPAPAAGAGAAEQSPACVAAAASPPPSRLSPAGAHKALVRHQVLDVRGVDAVRQEAQQVVAAQLGEVVAQLQQDLQAGPDDVQLALKTRHTHHKTGPLPHLPPLIGTHPQLLLSLTPPQHSPGSPAAALLAGTPQAGATAAAAAVSPAGTVDTPASSHARTPMFARRASQQLGAGSPGAGATPAAAAAATAAAQPSPHALPPKAGLDELELRLPGQVVVDVDAAHQEATQRLQQVQAAAAAAAAAEAAAAAAAGAQVPSNNRPPTRQGLAETVAAVGAALASAAAQAGTPKAGEQLGRSGSRLGMRPSLSPPPAMAAAAVSVSPAAAAAGQVASSQAVGENQGAPAAVLWASGGDLQPGSLQGPDAAPTNQQDAGAQALGVQGAGEPAAAAGGGLLGPRTSQEIDGLLTELIDGLPERCLSGLSWQPDLTPSMAAAPEAGQTPMQGSALAAAAAAAAALQTSGSERHRAEGARGVLVHPFSAPVVLGHAHSVEAEGPGFVTFTVEGDTLTSSLQGDYQGHVYQAPAHPPAHHLRASFANDAGGGAPAPRPGVYKQASSVAGHSGPSSYYPDDGDSEFDLDLDEAAAYSSPYNEASAAQGVMRHSAYNSAHGSCSEGGEGMASEDGEILSVSAYGITPAQPLITGHASRQSRQRWSEVGADASGNDVFEDDGNGRQVRLLGHKYEVQDVVGEGAYGMVMKCRVRGAQPEQWVAVKEFKIMDDDPDAEDVKRTSRREVALLRRLQHPHVVAHIDDFLVRDRLFIVMEYVPCNLLELLEAQPGGMDRSAVRLVMYQLCTAIAFIHAKGVIYRDIKPENLLVDEQGRLKLCDFGFAREWADRPEDALTDYVATRWYRAPELLLGPPFTGKDNQMMQSRYGAAIDIWAIGCLMGELMEGEPLFPGDSDLDQLYRIQAVLGPISRAHHQLFCRNPSNLGIAFNIKEPVTLAARYAGVMEEVELDFMVGLLAMDPSQRLTGAQCLQHPYLRDLWEADQQAGSEYVGANLLQHVTPRVTSDSVPSGLTPRGGAQAQVEGSSEASALGTLSPSEGADSGTLDPALAALLDV